MQEIEPLPLPKPPALIEIQVPLLFAVQAQPGGEITLTLPLAPSESKDAVLEDR